MAMVPSTTGPTKQHSISRFFTSAKDNPKAREYDVDVIIIDDDDDNSTKPRSANAATSNRKITNDDATHRSSSITALVSENQSSQPGRRPDTNNIMAIPNENVSNATTCTHSNAESTDTHMPPVLDSANLSPADAAARRPPSDRNKEKLQAGQNSDSFPTRSTSKACTDTIQVAKTNDYDASERSSSDVNPSLETKETVLLSQRENEGRTSLDAPANIFQQFAFGRPESSNTMNAKKRPRVAEHNVKRQQQPSVIKKSREKKKWVRMQDLSPEDRQQVMDKWYGLLPTDKSATVQDLRFEMVVLAILHARCKEASVRHAVEQLRSQLKVTTLTVTMVAFLDPADITDSISCLQYYTTKAKYIIQASRQIRDLFNGIVPVSRNDLEKLTGIGEIFSDLLACINTELVHDERRRMNFL